MDWVKLTTNYPRDLTIALGDDAAEVMFTRGIALAGEIESGGFIPDEMLHTLTRRPQNAKRIAKYLTNPGRARDPLWEKVLGGYQIINWEEIQAELEKYVAKKRRDKERKRTERALSRAASVDASTDSPAPCPEDTLYESESESKSKTAAAAAVPPQPVENLPGDLEILRSKLNARKLTVRWDRLTLDQATEISSLIDTHGDAVLVKTALNAYQPNNPPVFAQAWLNDWRAIPAPGALRALESPPCPEPGHQGTTARCGDCIVAAKIGENA